MSNPVIRRTTEGGEDAPLAVLSDCGAHEHFVQYYEDDAFLVRSLAEFVSAGLSAGESVIVLATAEHQAALSAELEKFEIDPRSTAFQGRFYSLDAAATLEKLMVGGSVDRTLFDAIVGVTLASASRGAKGVRIFGELVALLVAAGNAKEAVRLEEFWNETRRKYPFSLLCAYPMREFSGRDKAVAFRQICDEHSRVLPAEGYSASTAAEDRLRVIARLQQEAESLKHEIIERKRAELRVAENDNRMRHLLALMPSAVYTCDAEGRIDFYNRRAAELWGREPQVGEDDLRFCGSFRLWRMDGTLLPHAETPMARAIREGASTRDEEVTIERPDGSRIVVAVNIDPLRDENGRLCGAINVFQNISRRKEIETELLRSKEELSAFFENASLGLHCVGPDGIIKWANRAELEMLGYSRKEYIGHHISEFHSDREVISDILTRLSKGEKLCAKEARLKCKDGSIKHVAIDSSVLWNNGRFVHTQCFTRDITEHRKVQELSQRLAAIVQSSDDAILSMDLGGIVTSWNQGAERLYGYSAHEIVGRPIGMLIPPERHDDEPRILDLVRKGDRIDHYETVRRRKDGSLVEVSLSVSALRDANGSVVGSSKIARDITARKKAEEALRQSEALFRQLADSMPQIVWAARPDGATDYFNRRWYELTGAKDCDPSSDDWLNVLHPEDRKRCLETWQSCVRTGREYEIEYRFKFPSGSEYRWHLGRALPARDQHGNIVRWFGTCTDIDDHKRAEEKLERAVRERTTSLQEAVAQMEEFSYTVSHDLRAPLRAMHAYSEALVEDFCRALPPEALQYAHKIKENASRLDQMIMDVLTFSRIARSDLRLEKVDLDRLVREMVQQYPGMQPPLARVQVEPLLPVIGHEASLVQAISNLLSNAVKFARPGVLPEVRVRTERVGADVRLYVEDNGIGIEPRVQHRLFRMFERVHAHNGYEGTGVGLAIVRKAAERMGGRCGVESDGHNGSRFWLQLPAAATA